MFTFLQQMHVLLIWFSVSLLGAAADRATRPRHADAVLGTSGPHSGFQVHTSHVWWIFDIWYSEWGSICAVAIVQHNFAVIYSTLFLSWHCCFEGSLGISMTHTEAILMHIQYRGLIVGSIWQPVCQLSSRGNNNFSVCTGVCTYLLVKSGKPVQSNLWELCQGPYTGAIALYNSVGFPKHCFVLENLYESLPVVCNLFP